MDYLDQLIQLAQIEGELKTLDCLCEDWQIGGSTELKRGIFHIISDGECWVTLGEETLHLTTGDVLFLPHGKEDIIIRENTFNPTTSQYIIYQYQQRQSNPSQLFIGNKIKTDQQKSQERRKVEIFGGYFHYTQHSALLEILPNYWVLRQNKTVTQLLALLQNEATNGLGSASIINSLSSVLFTYLVRDFIEKQKGDIAIGILAALQDKRLYHAVNGMLQEPGKNWNMENLAEICSMSRATFIRLFKQKSGISPGRFLTELRMQKAKFLLSLHNHSMLNIALEIGYQSESHFSKAFKAYYGISPGKYRSELRRNSSIQKQEN
ncbi:histidine kinase [Mergibacter septicus]|uniref:AraC family transcriptional regulator n=1 Tax=Mergibacter septicus TaxID=221402 RepID=UPI001C773714|nr:AraC family transcriptional regulator [Mergibacter septicus]QDJ12832.1 histidine kinase [Mergibacter septicus]